MIRPLARSRLVGRARPLPYRGRGQGVAEDGGGPIDVIVPVHGAADEFRRCLASLLAETDLAKHRLVVVLDGPGQTAALQPLDAARARAGAGLLVLENPVRRGFVASVNRGMALSRRDVVLLNSDTVVTAGWLDKLATAARSSADIATVTPFSNNATICSLPRTLAVNAIPAGHDVPSFGRLVEACAAREYPRIPTGVGVCLYVKRRALDALGAFDESFGLGYGEETDFCARALAAGFVHVLDDATFIFHEGQRSFGPGLHARMLAAERLMRRRHPRYRATIAEFIRQDPLRPARERVLGALAPPRVGSAERVLHVVHGWPPWSRAGTETYARELALRQVAGRDVVVYARIADPERTFGEATELQDHGIRVRLVVNNFTQRHPLSRNAIRSATLERDFARMLDEGRPDLVHVHHLAGHAIGLVRVLGRRRIPYVYQLQDWWGPCARSNLWHPDRRLCPGPAPARCTRCLPLTRVAPAALWNRLLYRHRARAIKHVLDGAAAVVMGSRFIADTHRDLGYLGPSTPVSVLPYGVSVDGGRHAAGVTAPPLRFGLIGSILPHKGIHVAVEAFRDVDPARATLDVWGDLSILPAYTEELSAVPAPAVRFNGTFPEERKGEVFAAIDVLVAPSLGLESFGLVVREAMSHGVPVLASRRGALAEAFEDGRGGAFFEPGDARGLRDWIDRLCARPATIVDWSRHLPAVKDMNAHAAEIDAVYEEVLARGRARS